MRGFVISCRQGETGPRRSELPSGAVLRLTPDRTAVRRLFARVRASGRLRLAQDEALSALAAYGIPAVQTRVVVGADEAADAAATCSACRWS